MCHSRSEHAWIKWPRTSGGAGRKGARGAGHFHYGWCHRANLCAGDESRRSRLSAEILRDEDLLCAVRWALQRSSEQWLQRSQRKEVRDRLATLTPREFDVLKCVIAGRLNKHIASQLGTTEGTSKVHRGRVMEKNGCDIRGGSRGPRAEGRDRTDVDACY